MRIRANYANLTARKTITLFKCPSCKNTFHVNLAFFLAQIMLTDTARLCINVACKTEFIKQNARKNKQT